MQHVFKNVYQNLCYWGVGREKIKNNKEFCIKEKQKNIEDNLSTKKDELFECHNCFLQKTDKLVKIKSRLIAFCGDECYNEWLSNNNVYS